MEILLQHGRLTTKELSVFLPAPLVELRESCQRLCEAHLIQCVSPL